MWQPAAGTRGCGRPRPWRWLPVLVLLWLAAAAVSAAEPVPVAGVLSKAGGIHTETLVGLRRRLEAAGDTVRLRVLALDEAGRLSRAALVRGRFRLLVAVGSRATQAALQHRREVPVLSVLMPEVAVAALVGPPDRQDDGRFGVIYLDQPPDRQMAFIRRLLPGARRVGVLLGRQGQAKRRRLAQAARRHGLELRAAVVEDPARTAAVIQDLASGSDVILAVYDPVVINARSARWLLVSAYQKQIPVIGFSRAFVRAGALASLYSSPRLVGRQAAEIILDMAARGRWHLRGHYYPRYFSVEFNRRLARALRIRLPDEEQLSRHMEGYVPDAVL